MVPSALYLHLTNGSGMTFNQALRRLIGYQDGEAVPDDFFD
jgi:hypothetical protein